LAILDETQWFGHLLRVELPKTAFACTQEPKTVALQQHTEVTVKGTAGAVALVCFSAASNTANFGPVIVASSA
jgi:hypothetical protein